MDQANTPYTLIRNWWPETVEVNKRLLIIVSLVYLKVDTNSMQVELMVLKN